MKEKNELKSFSFPFLFSHFLFLDNAEQSKSLASTMTILGFGWCVYLTTSLFKYKIVRL